MFPVLFSYFPFFSSFSDLTYSDVQLQTRILNLVS